MSLETCCLCGLQTGNPFDMEGHIESEHKDIYKSSINQSDNIEIGHKIVFVESSLNQSEKDENLKYTESLNVTSEDKTEEKSLLIQNSDAGDNFNIIIRLGFRCLKVKSNPGKASENDRGVKFQKIESIKILLI